MDKILIYTDRHKRATFEQSVNEAIADCNTLINIFEVSAIHAYLFIGGCRDIN